MLMELNWKITLGFVFASFWFRSISCDEFGRLRWACICDPNPLEPQNYTPTINCSTSCDCVLDGERWNCSCSSEGSSPKTPGYIKDAGCFSACNCTSDMLESSTAAKKPFSNKAVIAVLLLCGLLTTIAVFASAACYCYKKDKLSVQTITTLSDKETSWNSRINLMSDQSGSFQGFPVKSPIIAGLFRWPSWLGSEKGAIPGTITQFSYVELDQATNKFSNDNLIGCGASSDVYYGKLRNGRAIAVKKLKPPAGQEDNDFLAEIEMLARLNHCHVVPLLGYCLESQGRQSVKLLVFEYLANGNLRDCLDAKGKEPIDWETRVAIAIGAAKGLEYLHEAAAPRILHRDIKSTNILLDDKYRAKITDLGMAKRLMADDITSCTNSPARMLGTFGYFAPEYAIVGKATLKSDVFSFGVVVLELITGRQPIQKSSNKTHESLVMWAKARLRDSTLVVSELPDPVLRGKFPEEEMQIMAHLARECLQWDPDSRPTMSEIVQILSIISPDKTKRRTLPASLFMAKQGSSSSSQSIKSIPESDRIDGGSLGNMERSCPSSVRWNARSSWPLAVDRYICKAPQNNAEMILSAEYMERLIFLTSKGNHSGRASDDGTVDLTEPRFESFVSSNIRSL
ncbi:receptor-like serine/threonine-protein kinase NCRK isoform X1 [Dioscorea cayenensis subsp. rotundata]|uniref:non-specific serine/threonine protein kinase n=1 Tax=Dioscorea cayennensis subsp. rotundata TaxID=55577 RepID=A0AB40BIZ6_DIOCR|nr:receptor-like serine/threonine-protein kinase NCRK isoform X1 [Dioscorea cayenensis subsp. rotundata]XP_039127380.1 receptor-like serine/threonine-protein kinase NCRK isoform X1 [Dioscorea cayenensis subsp. rotundata]XP_039127388.1 receptor-like serine/threonine-protein kinase NCRK isoform X1 [Dioscorea cayenensis subsp. rotundata]